MKKDIRSCSLSEIEAFIIDIGEPKFKAKQVNEWLWAKSIGSFEEMSNLSKSLREALGSAFKINKLKVHKKLKSNDGTIKMAFKLFDGGIIEGVLIPSEDRYTACISSQVGCSLDCRFCATGFLKRERNLLASEIYDQVVELNTVSKQNYDHPLTNIVYMGMGEPLLNYNEVLKSVEYITSSKGLHFSPKRITVSTAGIDKMIRKLGDDNVKFNLALSLHSAIDATRAQMMSINQKNDLKKLREALKYYFSKTKNLVTYEYILFKGVNDSLDDAEALYQFTKHLPSKVNIIEYNQVEKVPYRGSSPKQFNTFIKYLKEKGVNIHVRRSRGKDVDAACGQLANKH